MSSPPRARILLVEDDDAIADTLGYTLRGEGFDVDVAADGETAAARGVDPLYDVILLDVMLPGLSGIEVCRRIRGSSGVPILMLTARTSELDRVLGLEAGADDYVVKPFSIPELIARVRAILRRRELDRADAGRGEVVRVGTLELDPARHAARVAGRDVHLTPSEFRLLAALAERPGHVLSRRELMERLWDSTYIGDARAADVHVANLRRKIEADPERPERLITIRGAGYALAEV
ncbi:MAG: response regulator [Gaiellaceae bacterium]|jgi:two-component system response regulator MtrA|nr:response regulator transcription factor [Acidobacteriota bacterium]